MLVRLSIVRILVVLALLAVLSLVSWEFGLDAAPDILDHIDNSTLGVSSLPFTRHFVPG